MSTLQVKWTLFGSLAKGGYLRTFESVSHPGITGSVYAETRKSPAVNKFYIDGDATEYTTVSEVLKAYHAKKGKNEK